MRQASPYSSIHSYIHGRTVRSFVPIPCLFRMRHLFSVWPVRFVCMLSFHIWTDTWTHTHTQTIRMNLSHFISFEFSCFAVVCEWCVAIAIAIVGCVFFSLISLSLPSCSTYYFINVCAVRRICYCILCASACVSCFKLFMNRMAKKKRVAVIVPRNESIVRCFSVVCECVRLARLKQTDERRRQAIIAMNWIVSGLCIRTSHSTPKPFSFISFITRIAIATIVHSSCYTQLVGVARAHWMSHWQSWWFHLSCERKLENKTTKHKWWQWLSAHSTHHQYDRSSFAPAVLWYKMQKDRKTQKVHLFCVLCFALVSWWRNK